MCVVPEAAVNRKEAVGELEAEILNNGFGRW